MRKLVHAAQLIFLLIAARTSLAQNLLDPKTQPQFVNPLPIPSVIDARSGGTFTISITQFEQALGLVDPATRQPLSTKVWGYNGAYPGPTILARRNNPVDIRWQNNLAGTNGPLPHLLSIDPSLDWAHAGKEDWKTLGVPVVTHLHGGHTESASDGLPDAWYTPNFALKGKSFVKEVAHYSNDQEAATLWYHDHAIGITRLNVYAGLAGYYLLTDDNETALQSNNKLPAAPYDIGLAIQDRMFTSDGQLYYPTMSESSGAPEHSLMPEFFGNIILVNGKVWPVLEVEPRAYRFRILNGSDSRFYNLRLSTLQPFIQVGTDNGLLPSPVALNELLLGTGERRDVVVDFSDPRLWGKTILLTNNAKTPFPKGSVVDPQTTGKIMAFKITKAFNSNYPQTKLPASLRPPITPLQTTLPARKLILFEATDEYDRLKPMIGTVEEGVLDFHHPVTETINQHSTEIWEIYNETPDAHPIHLHMVHLQLINRQKFSASVDMVTGKPSNIRLTGPLILPGPGEAGWKDTYVMYPGEVTRVIANFDLAGQYVWHCHILSHEDHEMMRPFLVQGNNSEPSVAKISAVVNDPLVDVTIAPNPFDARLVIAVDLKKSSPMVLTIYDNKGALVKQVYKGEATAGIRQFVVDGSGWSNGTYFLQLLAGDKQLTRKLVLQR